MLPLYLSTLDGTRLVERLDGGVHCYTSASFSYLAKARVLGQTLKHRHPDWTFWMCITDREPTGFTFDLANEPFDGVIWTDEMAIDDVPQWFFEHDVIELCTAVKGAILHRLLDAGAEKVVYLDPDIGVFTDLTPLTSLLDTHDVVLTPHQITPEEQRFSVIDNEICSLRHGVYNLGFVAVSATTNGMAFARWWCDRLMEFCFDDIPGGLFTDQKWCDLAPALFDGVKILRDPGYNVASWNLSHRLIQIGRDGQILVNGEYPLRFYHFTKLGPVGDVMTQRYAKENVDVYELWAWYRRQVELNTPKGVPARWWKYGVFDNGRQIPAEARRLYRSRRDLRAAFPDPFCTADGGFYAWYQAETGARV